MAEEGWYHDPYGLHEARWISDGAPTALVRDNGVESDDDPPTTPFVRALEPFEGTAKGNGGDLRRADDAERIGFDPRTTVRTAFDAMERKGPRWPEDYEPGQRG
jgi:hypothetical protein